MSGEDLLSLVYLIADTPLGGLHLELSAPQGHDAVGAALALAAAEPLLVELEGWLSMQLDPAPAPQHAMLPAGLVWCGANHGVQLGLPWPLLAQAPATGRPALRWPELTLWVDVARWPALPARPTLHGASLLLLPSSFGGDWRVTLVQPELGFELDALWPGPGHAPTPASAPRAVSAPSARVQLKQPLQWPLPAVLGWISAPGTALDDAASAFDAAAQEDALHGHIVPALGGAALLVAAPAAQAA